MPLARDLLYPDPRRELRTHKLKRLIPQPNSFFMDVKCPSCFNIKTIFSHAQSVVCCKSCDQALCQPTGGRVRLVENCKFRVKKT
ncbi:40S ribosomal protein S27 [Aphelenchoides bicaudatus]|nr:40S ribosomal protein S27 [Aphelenchoides bicaudatus]